MAVGDNLSEKGQKDLVLVNLAIEGEQKAFTSLKKRYHDSIYFMMLKMVKNATDAEDLTSEAFSKAFNNLEQYSPSYAFSTWLFKIASNNCIDFIRKKRIKAVSMDNNFENKDGEKMQMDFKANSLNPEEEAIKKQKAKMMREAVKNLKPRYRELIEKRYFEELSYDEIAEDMDLPLGTVKAQLFRAREILAKNMKWQRHSM